MALLLLVAEHMPISVPYLCLTARCASLVNERFPLGVQQIIYLTVDPQEMRFVMLRPVGIEVGVGDISAFEYHAVLSALEGDDSESREARHVAKETKVSPSRKCLLSE